MNSFLFTIYPVSPQKSNVQRQSSFPVFSEHPAPSEI